MRSTNHEGDENMIETQEDYDMVCEAVWNAAHTVNAYGDIWCPYLSIAVPDTNHGVCTAC